MNELGNSEITAERILKVLWLIRDEMVVLRMMVLSAR